MSDGILSQDEIDALLRGEPSEGVRQDGDDLDIQVIGEIFNLAMGATAEGIAIMTGQEGRAEVKEIGVVPFDRLQEYFAVPKVVVESEFAGDADGVLFTVFPEETARALGDIAGGVEASGEEDQLSEGFGEIVAELTLHLSDALTSRLGVRVDLDPGSPAMISWPSGDAPPLPFDSGERVVLADCQLVIGETCFSVIHILPFDVGTSVVEAASRGGLGHPASEVAAAREATLFHDVTAPSGTVETYAEPSSASAASSLRRTAQGAEINAASFAQLGADRPSSHSGNIDLLLDVPLQVTVELGRTRLQIREVLELGKGSIVELEKLAGEPVEIYVNGKLLAKGEVVTIDENFGVKITDIVSRKERVSNLQ